ncbi:MAG: ATP-binding cassette domain-containing protein [Actinomycetales bacterium]|nr:ATP-binding cassette domain-containing protein [Actinomycetales bacterium]
MIDFQDVSVSYAGQSRPALSGATVHIDEGELVLVVGPTGSGKSTLLRCINGLVPHFTGGLLQGRVLVGGRDTRTHRPRDLADLVGFVVQDPMSGFVTDTVEDEIAYGMEALGVDPLVMRRRVEDTLDVLALAQVRDRPLRSLSGGQQQRVAIAAVLAAGPRILVLDEPTSALDPVAAEDVLAALHRLVHDLGMTVVMAEHRLERVVHHADRILLVEAGQASPLLDPAEAMVTSQIHPPVVSLGRRLHWRPLPLSVREARRRASGIRERLATLPPPARADQEARAGRSVDQIGALGAAAAVTTVVAAAIDLTVRRGQVTALSGVDLAFTAGEITAVMGRNGAGKSTLLAALVGELPRQHGRVSVMGSDPARLTPAARCAAVGLVPQDPDLLLYADTVSAECRNADADFGRPPGTTGALLTRIAGPVPPDRHPRDLSEGQRLALALAIVLAGGATVLLLDEPTRGLDYQAKARLVEVLRNLAAEGHAVVLATHDVELVAEVAHRVVVLADGEVVTDGPARQVIAGSPAFAPQVAKIMHPIPCLTVDDVCHALDAVS